ncbi:MAG: RagB/SusD family nutrient uptake outer membrane protein, partial [Bacteroidaceae bacterium]
MKTIFRNMLAGTLCASTLALTGCLEETFPNSYATADQLASSSKATEALMWEMPAFVNNLGTYDDSYANDWGYGSIMH